MLATSEAIRLAERAREMADQVTDQSMAMDLERIADAMMELLGERVWQPISTASQFDEIIVGAHGEAPSVARWFNFPEKAGWYSPTYRIGSLIGPLPHTHWKRLPKW